MYSNKSHVSTRKPCEIHGNDLQDITHISQYRFLHTSDLWYRKTEGKIQ